MRRLNLFQEHYDNNLFVGPDNILSQSFIPTFDNLAGVRFPIFNPRLGGKENYKVAILDESNNVLRQETVSESNLGWGGDFRYDFLPIVKAKNRKFFFSVSFIGDSVEDGKILHDVNLSRSGRADSLIIDSSKFADLGKKYITVLYTEDDKYPAGYATLNELNLSGDLVFQTYYQVTHVEFVRDSLTDFISRTGQDTGFFIFYILILCSLSALLIRQLLSKKHTSNVVK